MSERCFLVRNVAALSGPMAGEWGPEHMRDYRQRFPDAHGWEGRQFGNWFNLYLHSPCAACDPLADWLAQQPNATEIKL